MLQHLQIKIGMSAPRGYSSPHNMINGVPQSKVRASVPIGYGSPHSDTVGAPHDERCGMPHSKSGSISACPLSTRHHSWVGRVVLALDACRVVLAPDSHRTVRMGFSLRLVCGPLDANMLVARLDHLLGPGVHLGAVEEHDRRILELVISEEIANLELETVLQMYNERVNHLDERPHKFRQSQELP
ncbi:hypothetical protein D1007_19736 [Hordeum vulgare]|nr:hypothetical protein D1007_19736 [Hordeum vulgare]